MALLLVQLPLLALLAILYTGISYYLVGLTPGADNFFFFVFLMFATLFAAQSFVLFISAVVPNNGAGQGLGAAVFSYFFLFAGYFIPARDIPSYWCGACLMCCTYACLGGMALCVCVLALCHWLSSVRRRCLVRVLCRLS